MKRAKEGKAIPNACMLADFITVFGVENSKNAPDLCRLR